MSSIDTANASIRVMMLIGFILCVYVIRKFRQFQSSFNANFNIIIVHFFLTFILLIGTKFATIIVEYVDEQFGREYVLIFKKTLQNISLVID